MRTNTKTAAIWFQSTHSLRSATFFRNTNMRSFQVSIHALLAECDQDALDAVLQVIVSIHALLAECDLTLLQNLQSP